MGKKMDEATRKRVRAGRLLLAGKTPAQAAAAVGVARQTAYTWKARLDEGGIDALRAMSLGRPAQLDAVEQNKSVNNSEPVSPVISGFKWSLLSTKFGE